MRTKDIYITAVTLLVSFWGYSADDLPPPPDPVGGGAPPPPPGLLPIDENIMFLFAMAILLAGYQLIINRKNKKAQSKI